ncbi:MAG: hypothetical protein BGO98_40055 [Myxococcales bacterium 68-20]|nr:MAG: hypothetical protein BGO98_40055 [Myxococcales bacterium 68-20]
MAASPCEWLARIAVHSPSELGAAAAARKRARVAVGNRGVAETKTITATREGAIVARWRSVLAPRLIPTARTRSIAR